MSSLNFRNVSQAEAFSKYIRDAVVVRLVSNGEKFSAIRLSNIPMKYDDFLHKSKWGMASDDGIVVKAGVNAWNLAETVVHELGHILVGPSQNHNENWKDASKALGLIEPTVVDDDNPGQHKFDDGMRDIIAKAIERFIDTFPELVVRPDIEIPFPSGKEPLPFQIDGIRQMFRITNAKSGILLADEMGLGKTVEVMGYINVTHPTRVLVACPNNAKLIWKRHFEEWCIHKYDVEVASTNWYLFGDVVIMNYEAVRKWGDALAKQQWDLVVFDEAHYLKTPSAARSKASYAIKGTKAIMVTGTPIVNYPYELFPLIHYLDRENWPEYGRFEALHGSRSSEKLGRNLNQLNAKLRATIMVRRVKKDVMSELPKKRRQIIEFEVPDAIKPLIDEEKKLFNEMMGEASTEQVTAWNALKNESEVAADDIDWANVIESLTHTKRYAFERMAIIAHTIGRAKAPFDIEHIENALEAREKVVVFGHHRDVLTKIADHFRGTSVLLLGGNIDQAAVTQMAVDKFNNDETCKVFIAGVTLAAGYSLRGSSTVIFVEEDWVPGIMTQAEDRAHGIGRGDAEAKSMLIQHLVFEDSLDTYKAKLTVKKQKSIDRATK